MTDYRVALDVYQGPLDLLLFLIKREEIDIYDIPILRITEQYLQYVQLLEKIDPEVAGEFLVLAATLMEIKSRTLLPRPPASEDDEEIEDPRLELVRQLLEYKRFKDAAHSLGEAAGQRAMQHMRVPVQPPPPEDEIELENLEIWDLFEAFNQLLEQTGKSGPVHKVGVDDTPITLHAEDIVDSIQRAGGEQEFNDIFAGRNRAEMIGLFLALLELMRQHRVRVLQERPMAPILIVLLDAKPLDAVPDDLATDDDDEDGDEVSDGSIGDGDIEPTEQAGLEFESETIDAPASDNVNADGNEGDDGPVLPDDESTDRENGDVTGSQGDVEIMTEAQLPVETVLPTAAGAPGDPIETTRPAMETAAGQISDTAEPIDELAEAEVNDGRSLDGGDETFRDQPEQTHETK